MSAIMIYSSTVTEVTYVPSSATATTGSGNAAGAASSPSSSVSGAGASASAAAGAAGNNAAAQATGMDTNELIVFWLDITLLCVVAFFFLAALPRVVARFSRGAEWGRGLLMYGGSSARQAPLTPMERRRRQHTDATRWEHTTDQSHTLAASMEKGRRSDMKFPGRTNPPRHVPAWSSLLYPVSSIFAYNVAPGKSIGKLTLAASFVGAIVALLFVLDGNPLTESVRPGWIATGLIPVTIAFGTKNNLIGMFVGMGYERLNYIHRWVGIVSFVTANMHAIGYIYKWALNGVLAEYFQKPFIIHGTIALSGIELLFFASLGWVRNKLYTFFLFSHVVGYLLFLIALCFHRDECIKWVLVGAFIYAFDHLLRLLKTRISVARVNSIPELGLVKIEIPELSRGWRAGQHVRLRILSTELGWLGWSVAHPFTVANAPGSESAEKKGMTLLVKKTGGRGWTGKLYDAAGRAGYYPTESGYGTVREMRVVVEGPYGGLGNMMMTSFSSAMLVGGGSGVTFVLSQAEELVQAVRAGQSSLRFIEIVWITQDQASVSPLLPTLSALIDNTSTLPGILLKISIFYSRASPSSSPSQSNSSPSQSNSSPSQSNSPSSQTNSNANSNSALAYLSTLSPTLSVHAGRPALPRILDGLVRMTSALGRGKARGVAVGVCGPVELGEEVRRCVWSVDGETRRRCGGVEVHEEVFGW